MLNFRSAVLIPLFVAAVGQPAAQDFPTAPPKLKEAEAQGLQRVSTDELKQFIPGTLDTRATRGKHMKTLNADGTAHREGIGIKDSDGTWRFDEKNNTFCNTFREKKGEKEFCFAVFRAPDGIHYFNYETDTGFYSHAWRAVNGK